jgi:DNA-binding NtrC family response regulator
VEPVQLKQCRLVVVRGRTARREQVFAADVIRVGKASENDVVLDEETVSRAHFELVRDGKGWLVRDLRSTNGTFLDGAEIQSAYVRAGSTIAAGAARIRVQPFEERIDIAPWAGDGLGEMIGRAPAMRDAFALLAWLASSDVAATIEGPPGAGKETAARTLHARSRRKDGPFVVVAEADAAASVEKARGGTLYVVEPGDLAAAAQTRLVRALEPRRGAGPRLVAGSCRPIAAEVERGRLGADLRARLGAVVVRLPPLRERLGDLPLLAARLAARAGQPALDEAELAALAAHDWPGNLDELGSVIALGRRAATAAFDPALPFRDQKERWSTAFERRYLTWLLAQAGGNVSQAARAADMDRKYLHKLMRKHGL